MTTTWSCYRDDEPACGTCDSCVRRLEAFQNIDERDPIGSGTVAAWRTGRSVRIGAVSHRATAERRAKSRIEALPPSQTSMATNA